MSEFVLAPDLTILGVVTGSVAYVVREEECPETSRSMKRMTRERTWVLRTAYNRLEEQAKRLGASGVIGVRILHREVDKDLWEYTVQGTAVSGCRSGAGDRPFTSTLTGQEYFTLKAAGYRPVGVALGVCVYYQKFHQRVQQRIEDSRQNVERSDFTRGLYTARRNALAALETEAAALGADGVLDISITTTRTLNRSSRLSQGMMIEFTAVGTAVTASGGGTLTIDYALPLRR